MAKKPNPSMTVIRGGRVVDIKGHAAPKADILVKGDTIVEIGTKVAAPDSATVIDASGKLLHPGLINGHTHSHGNLAKGMVDRVTLELLLTAGPYMSGARTLEDKYLSSLIGACEMVMKGCTAAYDLAAEFPMPTAEGLAAIGQAYADVGMRAMLAPMVADTSFFQAIPGLMDQLPPSLQKEVEAYQFSPYKASVKQMKKALHGWKLDGQGVHLAVAPTIPHHCSKEFLLACLKLAKDYDTGLHTHVSESKVQVIAGYRLYGTSLTAYMDSLGLVGPKFTVAHGVWLDGDDMKLLGDKGASVSHNPGSNMVLGNGIADMRGMLDAKVNVGIGTDGASCSDNQNMYENMRLASMVSKVQGPDNREWITTEEVLHAATAGSARALGLGDKIGKLEVGLQGRHRVPRPGAHQLDPVQRSDQPDRAHGRRRGRSFGDDRRSHDPGRPQAAERRHGSARTARPRRRASGWRSGRKPAKALYDKLEKVVNTFCPGLAKQPLHIDRFGGGHHHAYHGHHHH